MSNEKDVSKELADAVSKVLSRREAVKKAGSIAAGTALAFLGLSLPGISQQKEAKACGWCCDGSCWNSCEGFCSDFCTGCIGGCSGTCAGCTGSCTSCTGTCADDCTEGCRSCTATCADNCENTCTGTEKA